MAIAKATTQNGLSHLLPAGSAENNACGSVGAESLVNPAGRTAARRGDDLSESRLTQAWVLDVARK